MSDRVDILSDTLQRPPYNPNPHANPYIHNMYTHTPTLQGHYRDMKDYCDKTLGAKLSKITVDIEGRNAGNLDVRGDEMVFRGEKGKVRALQAARETSS